MFWSKDIFSLNEIVVIKAYTMYGKNMFAINIPKSVILKSWNQTAFDDVRYEQNLTTRL